MTKPESDPLAEMLKMKKLSDTTMHGALGVNPCPAE